MKKSIVSKLSLAATLTLSAFSASASYHVDKGHEYYLSLNDFLNNAPEELQDVPILDANERLNEHIEDSHQRQRLYPLTLESTGMPFADVKYGRRGYVDAAGHYIMWNTGKYDKVKPFYHDAYDNWKSYSAFEKRRQAKSIMDNAAELVNASPDPLDLMVGQSVLFRIDINGHYGFDFDSMSKTIVVDNLFCKTSSFDTGEKDFFTVLTPAIGKTVNKGVLDECQMTWPLGFDETIAEKVDTAIERGKGALFLRAEVLNMTPYGKRYAIVSDVILAENELIELDNETFQAAPKRKKAYNQFNFITLMRTGNKLPTDIDGLYTMMNGFLMSQYEKPESYKRLNKSLMTKGELVEGKILAGSANGLRSFIRLKNGNLEVTSTTTLGQKGPGYVANYKLHDTDFGVFGTLESVYQRQMVAPRLITLQRLGRKAGYEIVTWDNLGSPVAEFDMLADTQYLSERHSLIEYDESAVVKVKNVLPAYKEAKRDVALGFGRGKQSAPSDAILKNRLPAPVACSPKLVSSSANGEATGKLRVGIVTYSQQIANPEGINLPYRAASVSLQNYNGRKKGTIRTAKNENAVSIGFGSVPPSDVPQNISYDGKTMTVDYRLFSGVAGQFDTDRVHREAKESFCKIVENLH